MAKGRTIGVKAEVDVSAFNQGLRVYLSGLNQMVSATTAAVSNMNSSANAVTTGIAAAVGVTAVNAIQAFVRALGTVAEAAIEQVGFFERLAISLNFYAARAIQSARDGLGLADAMVETRDAAEDLMLWLQQLALASPFTTRQVADSFRVAQAYGLSLDAARKLVPLILDFAAVNNLSDDILQRIALALGQIQARGKLASQEINQLANAGVPVRDILVKGLGVTRGEFEKLLEDGLVPSAPALAIIVKYLEQFNGMAEKVTRETLTGMISQFEDLRDLATRDIFGGISRESIPVLNQLSDFINQPHTFAAFKELGNILGGIVRDGITFVSNGITSLIKTLTNLPPEVKQAIFVFTAFAALLTSTAIIVGAFSIAISLLVNRFTLLVSAGAAFAAAWTSNFMGIRSTLQAFESQVVNIFNNVTGSIRRFTSFAVDQIGDAVDSLTSFSSSLADWGSNIVESLASGITSGVGIITDALMTLGNLFAFWLEPGSPPRLLPDLEDWGRETANVWLGAWRSADFGILNDIASDINGILKGLVASDQLGEEKPPRILIELRPLIADAIDQFQRFGQISQDSLNRIKKAAGPASNAIVPLLERYTALRAATDVVKASQEKLNQVTKKYTDALKPLQDRLSEISKLRETNDENREILTLQRTIANVGVSASIKRSAQLRIQEILLNRQVDGIKDQQTAEEKAAQAELDAAQKRADAAEEALDALKGQIDAQNTQLELYGEEKKILEQIRKEQERLAKEALKKQREELEKQLNIVKLLQDELKDTVALFKAQHTLADENATAAEKQAAALEIQRIAAERIVRDFEAVQLGIDPAEVQKIRETLVTLKDIGIKGNVMDDFNDSLGEAVSSIDDLSEKAKQARKDVQEYFENLAQQWDKFLTQIDKSLPPFLRFRNEVAGANRSISDAARSTAAANDAFGKGPPILRTFSSLIAGIGAAFAATRIIAILTSLPELIAGLASGFNPLILAVSLFSAAWVGDWFDMRQKTSDAIAFIQEQMTKFWQSDFWKGITERFAQVKEDVISTFSTIVDVLKSFFDSIKVIVQSGFDPSVIAQQLAKLQPLFLAALTSIAALFQTNLGQAVTFFFTNLAALLQKYWNPFTAALLINIKTVGQAFLLIFQPLASAVGGILSNVLSTVGGLPRQIVSIVGPLMKNAGRTIFGFLFGAAGNARFNDAIDVVAKGLSKGVEGLVAILDGSGLKAAQAAFVQGFRVTFSAVEGVFNFIQGIFRQFTFTKFFATFEANLKSILNITRGTSPIGQAFSPLLALFKTLIDLGKEFINTVRTILTLSITNWISQIRNIPSFFTNAIGAARRFFTIFTNLPALLANSLKALGTFFTAFKNFGASLNISKNLSGALQGIGKTVIGFLKQFTGLGGQLKISSGIKGFFSGIGTLFSTIGKGVGGGFSIVKKIFTLFTSFNPSSFINGFKAIFGVVKNIGNIFKGFLNPLTLITSAVDFFAFAFTHDIEGVQNGAKGLVDNIRNFLGDLISGKLWKDIVDSFRKGIGFINTLWAAFQKDGFDSPVIHQALIDLGTNIFNWLADIGGRIWESITTFWIPIFGQWVKTSVEEMASQIGSILIFLRDWIVTAGTWIYNQIVTNWIPAFVGWWTGGGQEMLLTTLQSIIDTLITWITTAATFIYDNLIVNWVPAFFQWVVDVVPPVLEALAGLLLQIGQWIITVAAPWLIEKLLVWATAFIQWLGPVVKWTLENLGVWMGALVEWIIGTGLPWLVETVIKLGAALIGWVNDPGPSGATTQIPAALGAFLTALVDFIITYVVPGLLNAGISIATGLWNGIKEAWGKFMATEVGTTLGQFITGITDWIINVYNTGATIAQNLWQGLADGVTKYVQIAVDAVTGGATAIGQAVKDFFGIASPSEWFRDEIGAPIVAGLLQGVEAIYNNPVFAAIHDAIVGGFDAVKEATIQQFVDLANGSVDAVKVILSEVTTYISLFETDVLRDFSFFADNFTRVVNALMLAISTAWSQMTVTISTLNLGMHDDTLAKFADLNSQLLIKIPLIVSTVVSGFQTMHTSINTEIDGIITDVIGKLAGTGTAEDTTSLAALLRVAMAAAGKIIGQVFVAGIAEGIKSEESLVILADAIYTIVKKAFDEANAQLETGSPSKRAARELGLPWSQGVASGILSGVAAISAAASTAAAASLNANLASEFGGRASPVVPGVSTNVSTQKNYYLNVASRQQSQGIINDFAIMRSVDI